MVQLLQSVWEELLCRQPVRIRAAFISLSGDEQEFVRAHLTRISSEADWHPEQVKSAAAALKALKEVNTP